MRQSNMELNINMMWSYLCFVPSPMCRCEGYSERKFRMFWNNSVQVSAPQRAKRAGEREQMAPRCSDVTIAAGVCVCACFCVLCLCVNAGQINPNIT